MSPDLKAQLPHSWPVFFAVHGSFTEIQKRAITPILAGRDVLMIAATATGKTEAAVAPLLERHLPSGPRIPKLTILYLCPTRALVRDLFERLQGPLDELGIPLKMKSGDTGPVSKRRPPAVLITTPESLDSLLTRAPRLLTTLRALVIDEIHLFDDSPRGDQLRCLLRRIERIQDYHQKKGAASATPARSLQRVALSATISSPEQVAARYLDNPVIVEVEGGREIAAEIYPLESLEDLVNALTERSATKTLVFCNTRNEVEQVASYLRQHLGYEADIFVHYSNLSAALRREVETRFAEAGVAICVSSSTLELGIDIGTIDDVALIGPPSTPSSFLQRIGRGGRHHKTTRVLCLPRSPREYLRFEALLNMSYQRKSPPLEGSPGYHFRPSVVVQQIFSLLKQSPTGGLRFADLRRIIPAEIGEETLRRITGHLVANDYLRAWRPGEWRPGVLLGDLADAHEIYSNIGDEGLGATIVDAYSGRKIAQAVPSSLQEKTLLMGGRPVEVAWRDRYTFGINRGKQPVAETLRFRTAPQAVPFELTQAVAAQLGIAPGEFHCLDDEPGMWLFHFWGDIYGALLAATLHGHLSAEPEEAEYQHPQKKQIGSWNEVCLHLPLTLDTLPPWDEKLVRSEARALQDQLERQLELGRFHPLLPPDIALQSVLEQIDLGRLEALYRRATLVAAPARLHDVLKALL